MKKEQDRGFWFKMTENKYVRLPPTAKAQKLQLGVEQPSAGGLWNPPKKKKKGIPHVQRQRSSCSETVGGAQSQ